MKTLKEFIRKSHLPAKLIRSTVKQFGGWDMFTDLGDLPIFGGRRTGGIVMIVYQIKDQYGNVRLEYLNKSKAEEICLTINAMLDSNVYTVSEKEIR